MWTSTSRSAMVSPSRIVPRMPRSGEPATNFSAKATSSRQACQASSTTAGSATARPSQHRLGPRTSTAAVRRPAPSPVLAG
jgi:hypothetical protein